jgi:hypothetical protein
MQKSSDIMSFNHLNVDPESYVRRLGGSVSILDYVLSPFRYEHKNKCRHELGLVGGTAVSHIDANLVDLESDLRGQTRLLTKCDAKLWKPVAPGDKIYNDKTAPIDTTAKHLSRCQMIGYRAVPLPPPVDFPGCK